MNCIMKNKLHYFNLQFVVQSKWEISNIFTFEDTGSLFLGSGITLNFSVLAAMLPIMAKIIVILSYEYENTCEF